MLRLTSGCCKLSLYENESCDEQAMSETTRHVHRVFVYLYTSTQSIQKQIVEYGILDCRSSRT